MGEVAKILDDIVTDILNDLNKHDYHLINGKQLGEILKVIRVHADEDSPIVKMLEHIRWKQHIGKSEDPLKDVHHTLEQLFKSWMLK